MESDLHLLESAASASANFDAFAWIELALVSSPENFSALLPLVSQLDLRLQTLSQTMHASLQHVSLSDQMLQMQIQGIQQAAVPLSRGINLMHEACTSDSASSATFAASRQDMHHLVLLHEAKHRIQSCSQLLVETARWDRNVRACFSAVEDPTILSYFFKGNGAELKTRAIAFNGAKNLAHRVREMQKSLDILEDLPGALDRRKTMERLCAQIEAAVIPRISTTLREDALDDKLPLQWCIDVLDSVDRSHLVRAEFCRARPAYVHRIWYACSDKMQTEVDDELEKEHAFSNWLDTFYSKVLHMLQQESCNIRELFGSDIQESVLAELLHNTLEPLTESFRDHLGLREPSGLSFGRLMHCFQVTRAFGGQVVQLFRSVKNDCGNNRANTGDTAGRAESIIRDIFEPYRIYFKEYTHFTSEALVNTLLRLVPVFDVTNESHTQEGYDEEERNRAARPLKDFCQCLEEASRAACAMIEATLQQCCEFTGGAAFPEAVEAIGTAVQQFSMALRAKIPAIRKFCKAETALQEADSNSASEAFPLDWSQFHASLAILKACGSLERQICALDGQVCVRIREQLAQNLGDVSKTLSPRDHRQQKNYSAANITLADLVDPTNLVAIVSKTWLYDEDPIRLERFYQFQMILLDYDSGSLASSTLYPSATLLVEAQRAVHLWTKDVQLLTYDTVSLPIARILAKLPDNKNWRKVPDAALGDLPTFSLMPQDYITLVADLLLSLLPQLEPLAESNGLKNIFVGSCGAQEICVQSDWTRLGQLLRLTPLELAACQHFFESAERSDISESVVTAAEFVDLWTAALASGALATLLRAICSIPMLSDAGAQHLAVDLGYFHNVLSALGCDDNIIVDELRHALGMNLQTQIQHLNDLRAKRDSPANQALAKLNDCIAAMRQRALEQSC
ncbi:hypothetical protein CCR75_007653 [Bremia lactucae]|uniref:Conserved oligomeric Golgi complex subunit 7 n=1 Tax=Bremia lactucae TaxID=4779 RepID=A0A976IKI1_BRELC|nr:hypothetical protein CCR75_007653 [Bremia lactucae]